MKLAQRKSRLSFVTNATVRYRGRQAQMRTHSFPATEQEEHAESFHLRLPAELIRRIETLARSEHRTKANMLRLLLLEALEAREKRRQS